MEGLRRLTTRGNSPTASPGTAIANARLTRQSIAVIE
jgi:hypothetical protein